MKSQEEEFSYDLECGGIISGEKRISNPMYVCNRGMKLLTRGRSGTLNYNGSLRDNADMDPSDGFSKSMGVIGQRVELRIERSLGDNDECGDIVSVLDEMNRSDPCKKSSMKKASKPPRPPKGPLLNAADLKLVKEFSELAATRRARTERMRALRKMNETKGTSSSGTIMAMVITVLFFLVIIFHVFLNSSHHKLLTSQPSMFNYFALTEHWRCMGLYIAGVYVFTRTSIWESKGSYAPTI